MSQATGFPITLEEALAVDLAGDELADVSHLDWQGAHSLHGATLERVRIARNELNTTLTACTVRDAILYNLRSRDPDRGLWGRDNLWQRCVFRGLDLSQSSPEDNTFLECTFRDCSLVGADFVTGLWRDCVFDRVLFDAWSTDMLRSGWTGEEGRPDYARGIFPVDVIFDRCTFRRCTFRKSVLRHTFFNQCTIEDMTCQGVDLSEAQGDPIWWTTDDIGDPWEIMCDDFVEHVKSLLGEGSQAFAEAERYRADYAAGRATRADFWSLEDGLPPKEFDKLDRAHERWQRRQPASWGSLRR